MIYKGYRLANFDGVYDAGLEKVVDGGEVIRSDGGNWDLIMFNDAIYYIATENSGGASSGVWGNKKHYFRIYGERL